MAKQNDPVNALLDRPFVITRTIDAPRALMFRVWTEPEHLMRWWGPKGFKMLRCKIDLRPGGFFHYGMRSPDGSDMWGKWIFREIVAPERLVFINTFSDEAGGLTRPPFAQDWPREMLSTITFAESDGKTTITVEWSPHNATEAERKTFAEGHGSMQQGWSGTFEQLAAYLASGRPG